MILLKVKLLTNLKQLAQESETFEEFHIKTERQDKLYREPPRKSHNTKNLKKTARQCLSFAEFHRRVAEK